MVSKIMLVGAGIATLAMPFAAFAQIEGLPSSPVTRVGQLIDILNFVIRILFTVLMIAAVAFILYAAFKYLTAMGNPEQVAMAHKALLWAAVSIAVALIATGVRSIVTSILQRQG